ncbi:MAG: T9SS type A sorting domain-containing protein [Paludibacter sp.]|nr:T9SS type A sorting domain-containing protein [Paludibacter sp.]
MKQILILILLLSTFSGIFAQSSTRADNFGNQNTNARNEGSQSGWIKIDSDVSSTSGIPALGNENISFYGTSEGIFLTVNGGNSNVKLYALTGQLLSSGVLTQGRFFTPARRGIYFLKINNKTYKVICK